MQRIFKYSVIKIIYPTNNNYVSVKTDLISIKTLKKNPWKFYIVKETIY
jgi:hypothetical protein